MKAVDLLVVKDYISGEEIRVIYPYDNTNDNTNDNQQMDRDLFLLEKFNQKYPGVTCNDFALIYSQTISCQYVFDDTGEYFSLGYVYDNEGNMYTVIDGEFINGIVLIDSASSYNYYKCGKYCVCNEKPKGYEYVSSGKIAYYEAGTGLYFIK